MGKSFTGHSWWLARPAVGEVDAAPCPRPVGPTAAPGWGAREGGESPSL